MKKPRFTPLQILVHLGGWIPLALIVYNFFTNNLTANPIQAIEQHTGIHALTFLLFSLACTPLASILGWKELTPAPQSARQLRFHVCRHPPDHLYRAGLRLQPEMPFCAMWAPSGTSSLG